MNQDTALARIEESNRLAEERALAGLKAAGDALLAKPRSPTAKRNYRNAQAKLADVREFSQTLLDHYHAKHGKS